MKLALLAISLALPLVSQTVTNPKCPNATAGAGVTPHCAILNWTAPATGSLPTGYNVYRSTATGTCKPPFTTVGCTKLNGATPVATVSYTDNSSTNNPLSEGTTYFYVVTSVNSVGESVPTPEVSGTFPPLAPGTPQSAVAIFN